MKFATEKELLEYADKNLNSDENVTQQNLLSIASSISLNKSTIKKKEQQLIFKIFDMLKSKDGLVDIEPLFLFLLSLLKLYEYYMIKCYNKHGTKNEADINLSNIVSHPLTLSESSKTLHKNDLLDEDQRRVKEEVLINKIDQDLRAKINPKFIKKYISKDFNEHIIITFEQAKLINKDFNQLYMNWSNYDGQSKLNNKKSKKLLDEEKTLFKPKISEKSRELYQEYRKKMFSDEDLRDRQELSHVYSMDGKEMEAKDYSIIKSSNNINNNSHLSGARALSPRNESNLQYINMMILKKQKKDRENEKINKENEKKKLEACTFKPKTNRTNFVSNREAMSQDSSGLNLEQRIEMLYKKGTACYKNKKDRNTDEIKFEKERAEFTFKPNINDAYIIIELIFYLGLIRIF